MTERAKLINKIHQTEDKIKDTERYISTLTADWEKPFIKREQKKLDRYRKELAELEASYQAFPKLEDVPAIHSYLENYGKKVLEWIEKCHELLPLKKKELAEKEEEFMKAHPEFAKYSYISYNGKRMFESENRFFLEELDNIRIGASLYNDRFDYIERDKEFKYIELVERVKQITGRITDADYLRVNEKGSLDGYINGENGRAKINTFEAGGWNIQRFHYRTKVTEV